MDSMKELAISMKEAINKGLVKDIRTKHFGKRYDGLVTNVREDVYYAPGSLAIIVDSMEITALPTELVKKFDLHIGDYVRIVYPKD